MSRILSYNFVNIGFMEKTKLLHKHTFKDKVFIRIHVQIILKTFMDDNDDAHVCSMSCLINLGHYIVIMMDGVSTLTRGLPFSSEWCIM